MSQSIYEGGLLAVTAYVGAADEGPDRRRLQFDIGDNTTFFKPDQVDELLAALRAWLKDPGDKRMTAGFCDDHGWHLARPIDEQGKTITGAKGAKYWWCLDCCLMAGKTTKVDNTIVGDHINTHDVAADDCGLCTWLAGP